LIVLVRKNGLVAMTATTRVFALCWFVVATLVWTLGTFVWTSGRKESDSAWYAFHTWHVCNRILPLFMDTIFCRRKTNQVFM